MNYIADAKQTLALENQAVAQQNITIQQLMNSAGKALAQEIALLIGKNKKALAVFICGKGNNAGDGFAAARYLSEKDIAVKVVALYGSQYLSPDALRAFKKMPSEIIVPKNKISETLKKATIIVDAIFGFSYKPPVREYEQKFIEQVNKQKAFVLAVDIPSGLEPSNGEADEGKVIKANKTLCFSTIKKGLLTNKGPLYAGEIKIAKIGIDPETSKHFQAAQTLNFVDARRLLPKKLPLINKKSAGRVLVIGGSSTYPGAAIMSAEAALRAGAGYVVLAVPESIATLVTQKITPEVIIKGLPCTGQGIIAAEAVDLAYKLSQQFDCLVIGPGLTASKETAHFVAEMIERTDKPVVVDADGLVRSLDKIFKKSKAYLVLTPHAGELSRLTGLTVEEIERDRFAFTQKLVTEKITVLLKGRYSVIASKDETYVNLTSNPGMATAGTGDILSGVIASFVAQGLESLAAAILGAFIHGLAGDIAAQELTQYSLVATDLIKYLPKAFKKILSTKLE